MKKLTIILLILLPLTTIIANPFLGKKDGPTPVRPPSSRGPERLVNAQLEFRQKVGELLGDWNDAEGFGEKMTMLIPLLGLSLFYGVLHGAGPGHRKTVIFSLFVSRKAKVYEPLIAGFLSAALHGISGIILILSLRTLSARLFIQETEKASIYLEGFTFMGLAVLALILLIHEAHHFSHDPKKGKTKGLYSTIAITSLFPCPVAVMILIFSQTMDILGIGILSVLSLSLGMGLVISSVGFMAWAGRKSMLKWFENKKMLLIITKALEMGSYLFLIVFSLWMALPFLSNWLPF